MAGENHLREAAETAILQPFLLVPRLRSDRKFRAGSVRPLNSHMTDQPRIRECI